MHCGRNFCRKKFYIIHSGAQTGAITLIHRSLQSVRPNQCPYILRAQPPASLESHAMRWRLLYMFRDACLRLLHSSFPCSSFRLHACQALRYLNSDVFGCVGPYLFYFLTRRLRNAYAKQQSRKTQRHRRLRNNELNTLFETRLRRDSLRSR